jgi:hypothetical protein
LTLFTSRMLSGIRSIPEVRGPNTRRIEHTPLKVAGETGSARTSRRRERGVPIVARQVKSSQVKSRELHRTNLENYPQFEANHRRILFSNFSKRSCNDRLLLRPVLFSAAIRAQ